MGLVLGNNRMRTADMIYVLAALGALGGQHVVVTDRDRDPFAGAPKLTALTKGRESSDHVHAAGEPSRRVAPKVGRNEPCPCGSGLKFKKCCEGKR